MNDGDRQVGEFQPWIDPLDRRITPVLDLPEVDVCEERPGKTYPASLNVLKVYYRHDAANDQRELPHFELV